MNREALARLVARHPLLKFAVRTGVALLAIVLFCTLFAWVPKLPAVHFWWVIYSSPAIMALTIWFLIRLWRRRGPSAVFAIGAALVVLYAIEAPALWHDALRAHAALPNAAPASPEVRAFDLGLLINNCEEVCIEVMARTGKDVIIDQRTFRLVNGEACRAEPLRSSYLQFLAAGFAGKCSSESKVAVASSRRIIVVNYLYCRPYEHDGGVCEEFPESFAGRVVTVIEDGDGTARVRQRWLEGGVAPRNGWYALLGLESRSVGKWTDGSELISRAVGQTIRGWGYGGDDLDAVLTELEWFLDNTPVNEPVLQAFRRVSSYGGQINPDSLRSHIERLIGRAERGHLIAGLNLIAFKSTVDVSDLRPRISALSQSTDSELAQAALDALWRMDRL